MRLFSERPKDDACKFLMLLLDMAKVVKLTRLLKAFGGIELKSLPSSRRSKREDKSLNHSVSIVRTLQSTSSKCSRFRRYLKAFAGISLISLPLKSIHSKFVKRLNAAEGISVMRLEARKRFCNVDVIPSKLDGLNVDNSFLSSEIVRMPLPVNASSPD